MSFSRLIQRYNSHVDPIWPDDTFNSALQLIGVLLYA
jgi:hypothetical protein